MSAPSLVLLPFNSLHGLPAQAPLRESAQTMLTEQLAEVQSSHCGYSLQHYLQDRFFRRDWTPAAISQKWNAFVEQENLEEPGINGSTTLNIRRGYLAVTPDEQQVLGEIKLYQHRKIKEDAQPFIYLRPQLRSAKRGYELMNACFALAEKLGYTTLTVGRHDTQLASCAMLNRLEREGKAEYMDRTRQGTREIGSTYRVKTAAFARPD